MEYPHGHHRPDPRDDDYQYPPPGGPPHAPPHYGVHHEPPPPQVYHSSHTGPGPDSYHPPPPGRPHGLSPYGVNEPPPPQAYHSSHVGPPPPQAYQNSQFGPGPEAYHPPPPPQAYHSSHVGPQPPQAYQNSQFGPGPEAYHPPPPPQVYHTSHSGPGPDYHSPPINHSYGPPPPHAVEKPHHQPHMPASFDHHSGHKEAEWTKRPSVRMYSKAETSYSLTIRDGKVILARSDPSDPYQQWVKDEKFSTKVKDEEGFPSFALVNRATGQAMKHSVGATHPVQLIPYNPDVLDESILWTESKDLGDTYRAIRMVNNIRLNVDALNGDKNHGGVRDGTTIVLWEWKKGDNQRWKIVPY